MASSFQGTTRFRGPGWGWMVATLSGAARSTEAPGPQVHHEGNRASPPMRGHRGRPLDGSRRGVGVRAAGFLETVGIGRTPTSVRRGSQPATGSSAATGPHRFQFPGSSPDRSGQFLHDLWARSVKVGPFRTDPSVGESNLDEAHGTRPNGAARRRPAHPSPARLPPASQARTASRS